MINYNKLMLSKIVGLKYGILWFGFLFKHEE